MEPPIHTLYRRSTVLAGHTTWELGEGGQMVSNRVAQHNGTAAGEARLMKTVTGGRRFEALPTRPQSVASAGAQAHRGVQRRVRPPCLDHHVLPCTFSPLTHTSTLAI